MLGRECVSSHSQSQVPPHSCGPIAIKFIFLCTIYSIESKLHCCCPFCHLYRPLQLAQHRRSTRCVCPGLTVVINQYSIFINIIIIIYIAINMITSLLFFINYEMPILKRIVGMSSRVKYYWTKINLLARQSGRLTKQIHRNRLNINVHITVSTWLKGWHSLEFSWL